MSTENQRVFRVKNIYKLYNIYKSYHLNPSTTMPHSKWRVIKGMSFNTVRLRPFYELGCKI